MKCPKCGFDNSPLARFCGGCGAELGEPFGKPVCPVCGAKVPPDSRLTAPLIAVECFGVVQVGGQRLMADGKTFFFCADGPSPKLEDLLSSAKNYGLMSTLAGEFEEFPVKRTGFFRVSRGGVAGPFDGDGILWLKSGEEVIDVFEVVTAGFRSVGPEGPRIDGRVTPSFAGVVFLGQAADELVNGYAEDEVQEFIEEHDLEDVDFPAALQAMLLQNSR